MWLQKWLIKKMPKTGRAWNVNINSFHHIKCDSEVKSCLKLCTPPALALVRWVGTKLWLALNPGALCIVYYFKVRTFLRCACFKVLSFKGKVSVTWVLSYLLQSMVFIYCKSCFLHSKILIFILCLFTGRFKYVNSY